MHQYTLYDSPNKLNTFNLQFILNCLKSLYELPMGPNGPTDQKLQRYETNRLKLINQVSLHSLTVGHSTKDPQLHSSDCRIFLCLRISTNTVSQSFMSVRYASWVKLPFYPWVTSGSLSTTDSSNEQVV